jgi:hypothetical protein
MGFNEWHWVEMVCGKFHWRDLVTTVMGFEVKCKLEDVKVVARQATTSA